MWNPFKRKPSAFELELAAVKALPEHVPSRAVSAEPAVFAPVQTALARVGDRLPTIAELERDNSSALAPATVNDKYPIIIGANLTGAYLSSAFRLCNSGWRYQYVDVLDELVENDPDTRGTLRARILGIACGNYGVTAPKLGEAATDQDRDLAKQIADRYALEFESIPCRTQRIQQLAWADWYGVSALENMWAHPESDRWELDDLCFIHSRRLNYTDPYSWDLHIYDQGLVGPNAASEAVANGVVGLRVSQYPGKFIVHAPSLSGQYPTRDGEGRYVAVFMLLKRMITRASAQDFERVIRPWVLGYFNRKISEGQELPLADKLDIAALQMALNALGSGSMNSAALPNSVKVELLRAAAAMSATEFLSFLNRAIAKSLLGQAFTTEPGPNGNLATAEVADKNTRKILEYSAKALCDTMRRDWAMVWFKLNYPGLPRHFCPLHTVNVSDLPSARDLMQMAKDGTSIGMPIKIGDLAERTYLNVVDKDDEDTPRTRMVTAKDGPNPPDQAQLQQQNQEQAHTEERERSKPRLAQVAPLKPKDSATT